VGLKVGLCGAVDFFGGLLTLTLYVTCNGPGDLENRADIAAAFLGYCYLRRQRSTGLLSAPFHPPLPTLPD
jgi:hypothetical protein